jgi:hypothetical protein
MKWFIQDADVNDIQGSIQDVIGSSAFFHHYDKSEHAYYRLHRICQHLKPFPDKVLAGNSPLYVHVQTLRVLLSLKHVLFFYV